MGLSNCQDPSTPSLIGQTIPNRVSPHRHVSHPKQFGWGVLNSEAMTVGPDRPETNGPARSRDGHRFGTRAP
jgi:hypothetical protein